MKADFDLANLASASEKEATVEILHPKTNESLGIKITVASPDSDKHRKLLQRAKNTNMQIMQRKGNKGITAEAVDESAMNVVVGSVLRWEGVTWGGTELECTEENVRQVFESLPWIKEQVDDFLNDRANFFSQ